MTRIYSVVMTLICVCSVSFGQEDRSLKTSLNVLEYDLNIMIHEHSDTVQFKEIIKAVCVSDNLPISLDLVSKRPDGKGMVVHAVRFMEMASEFEHLNDDLVFKGIKPQKGDTLVLEVDYSGVPADGLVIGKNKYGDRTIFGDNWPNRAHHWFACNDHPLDKAKVRFVVSVPDRFEVIANGLLIREQKQNGNAIYEYRTDYELPTKVIVIGVADFSVANYTPFSASGTPVSAWVYPQDEQKGTFDMALAPEILSWFESKIAPYPFDKLANVQSTTRYGGMENASCIFYDENAIDGKRSMESLIAHEIAHQWFGNCATEKDFAHLWLSEGFATYMTNVYLLETKGEEVFYKQMDKDRSKVITFGKRIPLPVIDSISPDLNDLLNANAYQKGSWILHMLRMKLGDDIFWKAVRSYFDDYKYENASSEDLKRIFEKQCSCQLDDFFEQWLYQSSNPELVVKFKKRKSATVVKIVQNQKELFNIDLDIVFHFTDGKSELQTVHINERTHTYKIPLPGKPERIGLDPKRKLLAHFR